MTFTKCQNIKRRVETMAICPFFEESMWNGNKCKASGGKDGAPIQKRKQFIYKMAGGDSACFS